jgi:hypothetical protein
MAGADLTLFDLGKTMTYKTMRFCSRSEKATEHHMNSGSLTCSLCAWKRLN